MNINNVADERKQVSIFLLAVLQSILNEQQKAKIIDKETADYIYLAVKDQAIKQGWLE